MPNIIAYSLAFSFFSVGITLLSIAAKNILEDIVPLFSGLEDKETNVEIPEEKPTIARYDVDAYRRRIERLKQSADADGLYEYTVTRDKGDATGTEIITNQFEIDFEKHL